MPAHQTDEGAEAEHERPATRVREQDRNGGAGHGGHHAEAQQARQPRALKRQAKWNGDQQDQGVEVRITDGSGYPLGVHVVHDLTNRGLCKAGVVGGEVPDTYWWILSTLSPPATRTSATQAALYVA